MPEGTPVESTTPATPAATRFVAGFANVYVDLVTGEIELGARVYRSAEAADRRRLSHSVRSGLRHVGVIPSGCIVPEASIAAALEAGRADVEASRLRQEQYQREHAARVAAENADSLGTGSTAPSMEIDDTEGDEADESLSEGEQPPGEG